MSNETSPEGAPATKRQLPEWLIGLGIAVVVVTVLLVVFEALGGGDDPRFEIDETATTDPVPVDVAFTLFDGTETTLGAFRGKPVVIGFWASWCATCVAEMADLAEVEREVRDRVTFIGLAVEDPDRAAAEAVAARSGVEYLLGEDPDGSIYTSFGGIGMPTTVFLDADGRVLEVHSGTFSADDLRAKIEELYGG